MVFGVDIGGVNIKITQLTTRDEHLRLKSVSFPFAGRGAMIENLITSITRPDLVIITQTLCANRTLFSSAREGTHYIIDMTERLFGEKARYLGLSYHLYNAQEAKKKYLEVAGRNWVATCYLASSYLNLFENGLVLDCGTNSTDIVPVVDSVPVTLEDNDRGYTRLKTGELLWSGLYFTYVPSLSTSIVLEGEEFQTKTSARALSLHVYVVLGLLSPKDIITAYGSWRSDMKLVSVESSVKQMLNCISADDELLTVNDAKKIAAFLAEKQRKKTEDAIKKVLSATKKKYGVKMKVAAIAGAGKDIILRKVLENLDLEILDVEKAASRTLNVEDSANCETSLGCALMGLRRLKV